VTNYTAGNGIKFSERLVNSPIRNQLPIARTISHVKILPSDERMSQSSFSRPRDRSMGALVRVQSTFLAIAPPTRNLRTSRIGKVEQRGGWLRRYVAAPVGAVAATSNSHSARERQGARKPPAAIRLRRATTREKRHARSRGSRRRALADLLLEQARVRSVMIVDDLSNSRGHVLLGEACDGSSSSGRLLTRMSGRQSWKRAALRTTMIGSNYRWCGRARDFLVPLPSRRGSRASSSPLLSLRFLPPFPPCLLSAHGPPMPRTGRHVPWQVYTRIFLPPSPPPLPGRHSRSLSFSLFFSPPVRPHPKEIKPHLTR